MSINKQMKTTTKNNNQSSSTLTQPQITQQRESLLNNNNNSYTKESLTSTSYQPQWITFPQAPQLKYNHRPFKGIFLAMFLMFAGMLFFSHGFHRYQQYSVWDLIAVWVLSTLLIIPGLFYAFVVVMVELKVKGFDYKNHPQLEF